ncbi:MAG: VOC family protein [Defluviitaleaceae bacterium]|nr:VOC family protein [Defluviitaleaceae bacterium]
MKIRPYLTFEGQCNEALKLYQRAFNTAPVHVQTFAELPPIPGFELPKEALDLVMQASIPIGDTFFRLCDCFGRPLNAANTEMLSICIEASVEEIKHAFAVLAEEGRIGSELSPQFYSPCAGVVFDKFGIMWNLVAME